MRYSLMNLLACPMCRYFPLKLYVFKETIHIKNYAVDKPFCDLYCARHDTFFDKNKQLKPDCDDCVKHDILSGIIICPKCKRWYPIIDGIPLMYPDEKRMLPKTRRIIKNFLMKHCDEMPTELKTICMTK